MHVGTAIQSKFQILNGTMAETYRGTTPRGRQRPHPSRAVGLYASLGSFNGCVFKKRSKNETPQGVSFSPRFLNI